MMMNLAIYIFLSIFYAMAFGSYPKPTVLATILFAGFFLFFQMWLRSKSRYIVSIPLFLLGIFFIVFALVIVSPLIHYSALTSKISGVELIFFCIYLISLCLLLGLLGCLCTIGSIKKKNPGEKEANSLTQLMDFAMEGTFQEALCQNNVVAWEKLATQGPLFMETYTLLFRHKKLLEEYLWPQKTVKLNLWDQVLYSSYQKKLLFYATKRVVELAEGTSPQTDENNSLTNHNDPLHEPTEDDRAVQKYPLSDYYNQLGWMYETGFGCQKDMEAAFQYYQKALAPGISTPCCPFDTYAAIKRVQKKLSR